MIKIPFYYYLNKHSMKYTNSDAIRKIKIKRKLRILVPVMNRTDQF